MDRAFSRILPWFESDVEKPLVRSLAVKLSDENLWASEPGHASEMHPPRRFFLSLQPDNFIVTAGF